MIRLNETHDPALRSWIPSANTSNTDFPIQNLPFGILRPNHDQGGAESFRGTRDDGAPCGRIGGG